MMILMVIAMGALLGKATAQTPAIPAQEQPEVLTRGPVHEAFAQPVDLEDQTGLIAPTEPPADIDEVLPAERPAGDQFAWVPGYWAWDAERNGYIWVSGCWRAVPSGMSWVPGYWAKAPGGWQWVAGFWALASNQEIEYLPAPPALTDIEPAGLAPSPDNMWAPPCWYWDSGQYIRRPGYWLAVQPDWVWVPSHYVWTPRGYVFVNGYWDYMLDDRGVLFAPVYFPRYLYERPGYSYGLSIVVDIGNLELYLFSYPQYSHYYFGDYYDSAYIGMGIYPWFAVEQRHTWYDPLYVHARWVNRANGPRWEQNERKEYGRRQSDRALRPPRTYREEESRVSKMPDSQRRTVGIAAPITNIATRKTAPFKFEQMKPEARQQISSHSSDVHKFAGERSQWESKPTSRNTAPPASEHVGSAPAERTGRGEASGGQQKSPASTEQKKPTSPEYKQPASPEQKQPTNVSSTKSGNNQPDREIVRTPPVAARQGAGYSQRRPPSRPAEERNTHKKK